VPDIPVSPRDAVQPGPDLSGPPPPAPFLSRQRHKILALVPLAFLIWVVVQYAVDVPYRDQWELVPLLDKTYHGELTFPNLWAQHNEHRILFPRIIMLALARGTGWNTRYELAVNVILAIGIFTVLVHQVKITGRKLGAAGLAWAIPATSLIVFSIGQYQNWLWGWQLQMFLNLLAAMGGIVLLAHETFTWKRFALSALLGVVALYSFANGVLFWPIGLVILLVVTAGARQRLAAITGWVLLSALALGSYFYHYQKPADHPPLNLIFKTPAEYAAYVFKYIGGIGAHDVGGTMSADGNVALIFGLGGTMALGWAGWMLGRKQLADFRTLLPYLGMSLYSVASALVTGVGRIGFGSTQAVFSRYSTMMVPFWASLVFLLILLARGERSAADAGSAPRPRAGRWVPEGFKTMTRWSLMAVIAMLVLGSCFIAGPVWVLLVFLLILLTRGEFPAADAGSAPRPRAGRRTPEGYRIIARWLLMAAIAMLILGSAFAVAGARRWSLGEASGREALLKLAANPGAPIVDPFGLSMTLYPRPEVVVERYPLLVQHRLSLFRNWQAPSVPP
jgi:hypothetical protein